MTTIQTTTPTWGTAEPGLPECQVDGYRIRCLSQHISLSGVTYNVHFEDAAGAIFIVRPFSRTPDDETEAFDVATHAFVERSDLATEAHRVVREMWGVSL